MAEILLLGTLHQNHISWSTELQTMDHNNLRVKNAMQSVD
jgi:hypothetical protein